jgi:hypothetical protein
LMSMAMPCLHHARRASGNVGLAEAVSVIRCAEYLDEPPALIEVGGKRSKLG